MKEIQIEELLQLYAKGDIQLIDVRSPSEYEEGTIPGSWNAPIFDDEERSEIGTIYKQISKEAAKERGLEIVSSKMPTWIKSIRDIPGNKAVFCWRGGMRSKTTVTLLSLMDEKLVRLTGGYRAFRKWTTQFLTHHTMSAKVVTIHGYTGSGKTSLLHRLKQEGFPVLDLEAMAGHRGSIFGHIGTRPANQKTFDGRLALELQRLKEAPYLIMEAESKRIGKVLLPAFLLEAKEKGQVFFLDVPLEERVRQIQQEYRPEQHAKACQVAFQRIKQRIHTPIAAEIEDHMENENWSQAIKLLLQFYYDPRYEFGQERYEQTIVHLDSATLDEAVEQIRTALAEIGREDLSTYPPSP
ncbi:tRNA 2-selenouridine(34) synthase MnmH [Marinicrinis sediminis]|uniref:tRNA 2-selenouridine(34) synthase MnmH n=1 Tax=Marinicrinis sediminis TaxID=1652465 RepID=A0ABW5R7M7_9BACL